MSQKYEIDLFSGNGYFRIESYMGLNLNVEPNYHDDDIKAYYFDSDYVCDDYEEEENWAINYLLLEIYNGARIVCDLKPFKPHDNRENIKSIENQLFAYKVINNINIKSSHYISTDSEFKTALGLAMTNKTIRDLLILLNKVSLLDENTLVNYYKIFDFVDSYIKLVEKYHGPIIKREINKFDSEKMINIKTTYNDLKKIIIELKVFKRITNNYLSIGLVARHGLQTQSPKTQDVDFENIFNVCTNSIRLILIMNYLSEYYNFDKLVEFDLNNK